MATNNAVNNRLFGVTDASNAAAGYVGEFISSTVAFGSPVALTTATTANVTSISLTAGDWDLFGTVGYITGAGTTITAVIANMSTTSATLQADALYWFHLQIAAANFTGSQKIVAPYQRMNISSTTTVYLVTQATFLVNTYSAYGSISARRVR